MAAIFICFLLLLFTVLSTMALSVNFTSVDVFQTTFAECAVRAPCQPMVNTTCLGSTVSHTFTTHVLANDSLSLADIHNKLTMWQGLKYVPKCWEVVQPFLCSIYMPKCENGRVEVPSYDMCAVTRAPCKIVDIENGWPEFLQCDSNGIRRFPQTCATENVYKEVKFNTTGGCEPPLVETDNEKSWYENVEGCGIQCNNPLYTEEEHLQVHAFIAVFATVCMVSTFFTLMTFFADWKNSSKYPALILFYMNGCFFVGSIGFLVQFPSGAREDIICRQDGTMRLAEPSEGENWSCVIVFVIVYYFIIAGCIWFVNLAYSWHLSFRALGTPTDALRGKTAYFHLIAWCVPLVLVVIVLAVNQMAAQQIASDQNEARLNSLFDGENFIGFRDKEIGNEAGSGLTQAFIMVDGDSVSGICFVGYQDHYYRAGFVLLPLGVMLVIGGGFLASGLTTLCNLERDNPGLLNDKAASRIKGTMARIGVFAFLAFLFVFTTFACHLYEFTHQASWERGFQEYLVCEANVTILGWATSSDPSPVCALTTRPNLSIVMLHLFSMFGAGIAMSMWVWTPSTFAIWKRFWRKATRQPINEPLKLKKSRMIAKAFAKKKGNAAQTDDHERLSVSFEEASHDDAIGMKFDLPKSSVSSDSSSVFGGNAVPTKLLSRRGAAFPLVKSPEQGNTVQADVVVEPPPPNKRKSRRNKKSKHNLKGSVKFQRSNQTQKKPPNMAFIEEEDEDAMAEYEEEEAGKIVAFMQGYRKSRENTPEEFVPGLGDPNMVPLDENNGLVQDDQGDQAGDKKCVNCAQEYQQGYYHPDVQQQYPLNYPLDFPQDCAQNYPQGYLVGTGQVHPQNFPHNYPQNYNQDFPQSYPQGTVHGHPQNYLHNYVLDCKPDFPQKYLQGYLQGNVQAHPPNYPQKLLQDFPLNYRHGYSHVHGEGQPVHQQNIHRDFTNAQEAVPHNYLGQVSPDGQKDYPESYADDYGSEDDVELPPHLCGSVTPEENHQFAPVQKVPSLFFPGARRRAKGHHPRGHRPMGHMVIDGGGLPGQNYLFDSVL